MLSPSMRGHGRRLMVTVFLWLLGCGELGPPRDAVYFLDRLHELDDLPRLERGQMALSLNYDPAGGNELDGRIYPWVDGYRNVLLSVDGPGCIHRISTGELDEVPDTTVEIRLDDGLLLTMSVTELFDPATGPFAGGLTLTGDYPAIRYPTIRMPMPFAEHAEVRLISPSQSWGSFWQIGYTRYDAELPVETLRLPMDPETADAFARAGAAWDDALTGRRRSPAADIERAQTLAPGEVLGWDERGCGTIERLDLALAPNVFESWDGLRLRARWDGAETPAIDLPVAEFMGSGYYVDDPSAWFDSLIMGQRQDRAYLRLPMPYREAAELELINEGAAALEVRLKLWRRRCVEQPVDFGYLHAAVETQFAASETSSTAGPMAVPIHRLLEREGRGKVVGTQLRVDWAYADEWWGEGDWQIWADEPFDAWPPRYHGTGTEEFYDGGWTAFHRKALAGWIKQRPGRVTIFGFRLNDAFNYERQLRMQVETVGLGIGEGIVTNQNPRWSSTVYWYDEQP